MAAKEELADVSMRSFTRAEKEKMLQQKNTEVYERAVDESKFFKPWPVETTLKLCVLMHKWFSELLLRLPEANDNQLRWIMFQEHPNATLNKFISHYVIYSMTSTSRAIVDELFKDFVSLVRESQRCTIIANGDETVFKNLMGTFMKENKIFFSTRNFTQLRGVDEVPQEPVSEELLATLASRREKNERPGEGLMAIDKMQALTAQRELLRASQRASKTNKHTEAFGVTTLDLEDAELVKTTQAEKK